MDLDAMLGANWLARAGVLLLSLGVVFFLKLAYDRAWVPILGRFAIGVLGGLALLVVGDLLRNRKVHPAFTQTLSGGGAVISYVTIYLAWVFPEYRAALSLTLATEVTLLALASALLGAYAVWRNLPTLAGVAVVLSGLLVAPAGAFSTVGLLYVAFLNAALLAAASWRGWPNVVLSAVTAANTAHLLALANGVDWKLVAASSAVVNVLGQVAAHRAKEEHPLTWPARHVISVAGPILMFVTLGLALQAGELHRAWGWAAVAVAGASLVGAFASHSLAPGRLAPGLAGSGALLLLAWPFLHFPEELWQVLAFALLGVGSLGISMARAAPASPLSAHVWVLRFSTAAAGLGLLSLLGQAQWNGAVDAHPWGSGGLALLLFGLGAAQWAKGVQARSESRWSGLGLVTVILLVWPFLQFADSLWQTFLLVVAAALLAGLALAWPNQGLVARGLAASAAAVGTFSLLLLAARLGVHDAQPVAAGSLALGLFGVAGFVWATTRWKDGETFPSVAGLVVCGALLAIWPLLQFPDSLWQTFTYGAAGFAFLLGSRAMRQGQATVLGFAAGSTGLAVFSLWVLAQRLDLVREDPWAAGGVSLLLLGLSSGLWWVGGRTKDPLAPRVGVAAATAVPILYMGYLLQGWQVAVAWAVVGLALAVAGMALRELEVRIAAFATFALVVGRVFLVDLQTLDLPFRVLTFVLTGALLLVAAYLFARQRKPVEPSGTAAK